MLDELRFLFESRHYAIDKTVYEKVRDSAWVDAFLETCRNTSPNTWNSHHLVAIAQLSTPDRLAAARTLLLRFVQHYSEE